jgi:hypothetical protein
LAISDPPLAARLDALRAAQTLAVPIEPHDPGEHNNAGHTDEGQTNEVQTNGVRADGANDPV